MINNSDILQTQMALEKLVEQSCLIFEENLVGIYIHGSYAMGCFNPLKSDLDILIVTINNVTDFQKMKLMEVILVINENVNAKGIEISVIKSVFCKKFEYPTPFEFHFSNMHLNWFKQYPEDYINKMRGVDSDLAAHFVITKNRGVVLYGEPIHQVFGTIPSEAYFDSIKSDINESHLEIFDNPVYYILNLCRVLAYKKKGLVLSKKEGGEWALDNIDDKYVELVMEALMCYTSDQTMVINRPLGIEYCSYMKTMIDRE